MFDLSGIFVLDICDFITFLKFSKLFFCHEYISLLRNHKYIMSWIIEKVLENQCHSGWCRERDSNPHEHSSLPPQDSVSTSSTTSALIEGHNNYGKTQYICKKISDSLFMILFILFLYLSQSIIFT